MSRVVRFVLLISICAGVTAEAQSKARRRPIRQTSAQLLDPEFVVQADEEEAPVARDRSRRSLPLGRDLDSREQPVPDPLDHEARWELDDPPVPNQPLNESARDVFFLYNDQAFEWQVLPPGLMYQSYLAGPKEPRFNTIWLRDRNGKLNWESQLGGRVGLLRHGTRGVIFPQGWQLDMEGGAQARVLPESHSDLEAADFRFGLLSTWRRGPWAVKAGYYHISSHVGDEFLISNPGYNRLNYVRDSAIAGVSYDLLIWDRPDVRFYGEIAYALGHEDGAEPLEFQYGAEYSPFVFNGIKGAPFVAVNGNTREDHNWITGVNVVAGWQWRGEDTNHRFRAGLQYYSGPSLQYSFSGQNETVFGWGFWFDY